MRRPMTESSPAPELEGPRPARVDERGPLLETVEYIFRTSQGRPPTMATDYPHVYDPGNLKNVIIVKSGEQVVSSTAVWTNRIRLGDASLRVGGINAVGTLPDYRKRGLGSQVMQAAHGRMRDLGCHVGLLGTGIVDWYRRMGWENAGIQRTYRFDRANVRLLPELGVEFEEAGDERVEQLLAVHHADQIGGLRTADLFCRLLTAKKISNIPVARTDAGIIAYLLVAGNTIVEWGGPAEAVAGLVRTWFEKQDDPEASTSTRGADNSSFSRTEIALIVPGVDHPFAALLESLRIPHLFGPARMLLLLDPQSVLEAFGHTDIAVSQETETFTLTRGDERGAFSRQRLTRLFFGPERVSNFAADLFPLPFCQWRLECV